MYGATCSVYYFILNAEQKVSLGLAQLQPSQEQSTLIESSLHFKSSLWWQFTDVHLIFVSPVLSIELLMLEITPFLVEKLSQHVCISSVAEGPSILIEELIHLLLSL